jgi:hypothetical protein
MRLARSREDPRWRLSGSCKFDWSNADRGAIHVDWPGADCQRDPRKRDFRRWPVCRMVDGQKAFDQFQFVGIMDEHWAFGQSVKKIKVVTEIFYTTSVKLTALLLAQERKIKGEAAAAQLAKLYSSLPTLWK